MRSTNDIIAAIKDGEAVEYEELRMACLVMDALLFFAHGNIRRLLAGGIGAELTIKDFPDAHADLGISKQEWEAMRKDPIEYLGRDHIPGTSEYESRYKVSKALFNRFVKNQEESNGDSKNRMASDCK